MLQLLDACLSDIRFDLFFPASSTRSASWWEEIRGSHVCDVYVKLLSEIFLSVQSFIYSVSAAAVACLSLSQLMRVYKCDKKSIANLLVNVNNNSITMEFLKMILSFSHVIVTKLSCLSLINEWILKSWMKETPGIHREIIRCWKEFQEIFFVARFDLGSESMGESQEFLFSRRRD